MRISFYTLGCKANQAETAAMERMAAEAGWEPVPFGEPCDAAAVNTCTVTGTADKKSRAALRRARELAPTVGVCGCYSQREGARLVADGLADVAFGNRDHAGFLAALFAAAEGGAHTVALAQEPVFRPLPAAALGGRTRALLKVQDGCENRCAYCIIPAMRGPNRCIDPAEAVRQARLARDSGAKELVLTGIEVASYKFDAPSGRVTFAGLVARICEAVPELRIRLGSLEPRTVDAEFCALSRFPNLCPHFHLALQSGCDRTLARMRRRYNSGRFREAAAMLRASFPDCSLTTDLLVGFPGETEEDFAVSVAFACEMRFLKVHVFPYSIRQGTEAAGMPEQLPMKEKASRGRRAARALEEISAALLEARVGQTLDILCEDSPAPGRMRGYTANYIPVVFDGDEALHNTLVRVRILSREGEELSGVRIEPAGRA